MIHSVRPLPIFMTGFAGLIFSGSQMSNGQESHNTTLVTAGQDSAAESFHEKLIQKDLSLHSSRIQLQKHQTVFYDPSAEYLKRVFACRVNGLKPPPRSSIDFALNEQTEAEMVEFLDRKLDHKTFHSLSCIKTIGGDTDLPMFPAMRTRTVFGGKLMDILEDGALKIKSARMEFDQGMAFYIESRIDVEFALGAGFGSNITNITSLVCDGEMTIIETDKLVPLGPATLEIDQDLIVRKAAIRFIEPGHNVQLFITTEGTIESYDGSKFAASSHFRRVISPSGDPDGKPRQPVRVEQFGTSDHKVVEFHFADDSK